MMKIKFDNQYLVMLAEFAAKQDIRYYLNGFHVKPHPEKGVILTASNGHCLVTIHDKNGFADGNYIFPISKGLLAASKLKRLCGLEISNVLIVDGVAMVTAISELDDVNSVNDVENRNLVSYLEFITPIDGKYPNVGRFFKSLPRKKATPVIPLDPSLLAKLTKLKVNQHSGANFHFYSQTNAVAAVMGRENEIVAMIMPMRFDVINALPEFTKLSGELSAPAESTTQTTSPEPEQSSAA